MNFSNAPKRAKKWPFYAMAESWHDSFPTDPAKRSVYANS